MWTNPSRLLTHSVTVTAAWSNPQTRTSIQVIPFPPYDVALIQVDSPFNVRGSTTNYYRDVFRDGRVSVFRFSRLACRSRSSVAASISLPKDQAKAPRHVKLDGTVSELATSRRRVRTTIAECAYWYPSTGGLMIAGGDEWWSGVR